jgi:hypothetical protein
VDKGPFLLSAKKAPRLQKLFSLPHIQQSLRSVIITSCYPRTSSSMAMQIHPGFPLHMHVLSALSNCGVRALTLHAALVPAGQLAHLPAALPQLECFAWIEPVDHATSLSSCAPALELLHVADCRRLNRLAVYVGRLGRPLASTSAAKSVLELLLTALGSQLAVFSLHAAYK